MKQSRAYVGIILGLAALAAATAEGQVLQLAKGQLTCGGTVVDAAGKPVGDAEVVAYRVNWGSVGTELALLGEATTKADGTFVFRTARGKGEAFCMIAARKSGLALGWINWSMQKDCRATIRLGKPTTLRGRACIQGKEVTGLKGAEIRGVFALNRQEKGQALLVGLPPFDWVTARTDAKGNFAIEALPVEAEARMRATAPGYAAQEAPSYGSKWLAVGGPYVLASFFMGRATTFRGKLVDVESGASAEKVRLVFSYSDRFDERCFFPAITAMTKADGTFEVSGLGRHAYHCCIQVVRNEDDRLEWAVYPNNIVFGESKPETLSTFSIVRKGGHAEIEVVDDETGDPIAGAQIDFDRTGLAALMRSMYFADHRGKALLRVLPGRYRLDGSSDLPYGGAGPHRTIVEVTEGGWENSRLALTKFPSISGTVRGPDGKALAEAEVKVSSSVGPSTETDREGRFKAYLYQELIDQGIVILVRHLKSGLAAVVERRDLGEVNIQVSKGVTITGRIVSSTGGPLRFADGSLSFKAPKGVTVARLRGPETLLSSSQIIAEPNPDIDKDGRYTVSTIPAGQQYVLMADAQGHGGNYARVDLRKAGQGRVVVDDIVLPPANRSVAGVVVDETGAPVANAKTRVVLQQLLGSMWETIVLTDAKGRFKAEGVVDDDVLIQVTSPDKGLCGSVNVKAGQQDVRIVARKPMNRD